MRTAIILNGNIRTWKDTKKSFTNFFKDLDYDVFLSTYNLQYQYHPHIQNVINDTGDVLLSNQEVISQIDDVVNLKKYHVEDASSIARLIDQESHKFHVAMRGSNTSYAQYRKFKLGTSLVNAYEAENKFAYDFIIKTRCDLVYNDNFTLDLENMNPLDIWVDKGNVFPNDCIIIGSSYEMKRMSNFMYDEFYKPYYPATSNLNAPHGLLKNAAFRNCLTITSLPLIDHVLRKDGKVQKY